MDNKPESMMIDEVKYIREDLSEQKCLAEKSDGLRYVILRCDRASTFVGYLSSRNKKEAVLLQARRIYYWDGAASLSQLAVDGTSKPGNCKFPCKVTRIELTDVIEVIDVTQKAKDSIESVAVWSE